jgi:hypothetical protein
MARQTQKSAKRPSSSDHNSLGIESSRSSSSSGATTGAPQHGINSQGCEKLGFKIDGEIWSMNSGNMWKYEERGLKT